MTLALIALVSGLVLGAIVWLRPSRPQLEHRQLTFSSNLTSAEVTALLDVVAALPRGAVVDIETAIVEGTIRFGISAPANAMAIVESSLSGISPDMHLAQADRPMLEDRTRSDRWVALRWHGVNRVQLRTDGNEVAAAALLGGLASAKRSEAAVLRWRLRPSAFRPARVTAYASRMEKRSSEAPTHNGLSAEAILSVSSTNSRRVASLIGRITTPLRSRVVQGGLSARRRWPGADLSPPRLSAAEVTGILGWPIGGPQFDCLHYETAPRIAPAALVPRAKSKHRPRVFGVSNVQGNERRELVQPTLGAACHTLISGPSGSGKSWLMTNLVAAEIASDHAVVLVDMKGDTANDVLARINGRSADEIVVLEPALGGPVPGLRTFGGSPELAADLWLSVFRGLFPENFGVRSQRYMRMGLNTLARADHDATIAQLPRLFQDERYRRSLVARLDDPLLIGEWTAFEQLSTSQKSEHLLPALGKVSEVLARKSVRAVLAQSRPRITIRQAVQSGKVIIVSLPPGVIGQPAAQLLGALVIFEVWQAVMAKQSLSPDRRKHVALFIDEPGVLGSLPIPLDTLLETARGMNCGLTMATQSVRQLPERVGRAALTNAATIATFRPSQADAAMLARELPGLTADQLQQLAPFTIALRLGISSGVVAPVCTATTLLLPDATSDPDEIRRISSATFGMHPDEVDRQLGERLGTRDQDAAGEIVPIGETGAAQ